MFIIVFDEPFSKYVLHSIYIKMFNALYRIAFIFITFLVYLYLIRAYFLFNTSVRYTSYAAAYYPSFTKH